MKKLNKVSLLRCFTFVFAVILLICTFGVTAFADSIDGMPYKSYTYWKGYTNKAVQIKAVFEPVRIIEGSGLDIGAFKDPEHMFTYGDNLYLLDSGNGRIIKFDSDYNVISQINSFEYKGEKLEFKGAKGLFLDESGMYLADTANKRVLYIKDGKVQKIITKPQDTTVPDTLDFAPSKLVRDDNGYLYVLCEGCYYGMMVFSETMDFLGFFGANSVNATFFNAVSEMVTSLFETEEKHAASVKQLPFTMRDICIDKEGFVVTVNSTEKGQIRRFGISGTNIIKKTENFTSSGTDGYNFADNPYIYKEIGAQGDAYITSTLTAIASDKDNYYYAADSVQGRIFMYDTHANLITVFGGGAKNGRQIGTFTSPSSIAIFGEDLLVSDFVTGKITVFRLTDYGKTFKTANSLTIKSKYEQAKPYWEKIHAEDKNNQLAYEGLARAALREKDYSLCMDYAKKGLDRKTYSEAFSYVRNQFISKNFWWIFILIIALMVGTVSFISISKRKQIVLIKNEKLRTALTVTFHPIEGFNNIKYKNMGSPLIATALLLLFYISSVSKTLNGGFMFGIVDLSNFNAILTLLGTVGIVLLWTVANWLVCVLFEGKGRINEIYCATCYCLTPMIIYNFAYLILSNVMIPSATSPFGLISTVCYIITAVLLLLAITTVHEFSFFKSMAAAATTILGMLIVGFVLFAMLTLWQELVGWIVNIYNEVTLR